MSQVASSAKMVGRDAELATLLGAFDQARDGHPATVVVRGEAGIGKTRLLHEFLERADRRARPGDLPVIVGRGQCVDLGPVGAPFAPMRRVLRDVWSAVGQESFAMAARSPVIMATLGTLVPEADVPDGVVPGGPDVVAEAIETLIESLSVEHHLVLVLEDLHWADPSTLALLKTLATTLRGEHVMLLVTYRSDDVDRFHPLRPVIAELERNRGVVRVDLARLTPRQVEEQASGITGGAASAVDLAERSGGIPFLVEELLGLQEGELPETLRDLVLSRYERLPDSAKGIVRVAAAGGVHVEHDVLLEVCTESADEVDDALREAIDARVLVGLGDGYAFRHALTQEAVHDDLLASERARFHAAYGSVLEQRRQRGDAVDATELAYHWKLARDPRRALAATVMAFDETKVHEAGTTFQLAEEIADLWPQVPDAQAVAGRGLWKVYLQACSSLDTPLTARGIRFADEGLAHCPPEERHDRAHLLFHKRMFQYEDGTQSDPTLLREAEELLTGSNDPSDLGLLSRIIGSGVSILERTGADQEARLDLALDLAERSGSAAKLAEAALQRASYLMQQARMPEALEVQSGVADVDLDPYHQARLATFDMSCHIFLGHYDLAIARGEEMLGRLRGAGLERSRGMSVATNLMEAAIGGGRPALALDLLPRTLQLVKSPVWLSYVARCVTALHAWDDNPEGVAEMSQLGAPEVRRVDLEERAGWVLVDTERLLGKVVDASTEEDRAALVATTLKDLEFLTAFEDDLSYFTLPLAPAAARAVAAAHRHGVPVEATLAAAVERLIATPRDYPIAGVWRALAHAELTSVDPGTPEAVAAWRTAVAELESLSGPVWYLPYANYRLGEALIAAGDREAALVPLRTAAEVPPDRGVRIVSRWARELAERAGMVLPGAAPRGVGDGGNRHGGEDGLESLTAREKQVLALVAEGLSNPEIGKRLFISPKTVSVHVSAMFGKTGTRTRSEAAAYYASRATTREAETSTVPSPAS